MEDKNVLEAFRGAVKWSNNIPSYDLSWFLDDASSYEAGWSSLLYLEALERLAVAHVHLRFRIVARPVVSQRYSDESLFSAEMSSGGVVMALSQHLEMMLFRNHQLQGVLIVTEGCVYLRIRAVAIEVTSDEFISRVVVGLLPNFGAPLSISRGLGVN